jgi:hypothetical protein
MTAGRTRGAFHRSDERELRPFMTRLGWTGSGPGLDVMSRDIVESAFRIRPGELLPF